jgi:hypothetical protein
MEGILMSFKNALAFLELVRKDEGLRCEVATIASAPDLARLARLAERNGLPCGPDDILKAWRKDYLLRQVVARLNRS